MVDKATPVAFLCNYEVLEMMKEVKKRAEKSEGKLKPLITDLQGKQRLATVIYETLKYLQSASAGKQTADQIEKFMLAMKEYPLSKLEKLQIVNLTPQSLVDAVILVKDWEQRTTEDQLEKVVQLVQDSFPECKKSEPEQTEEEEDDGGGEAEGDVDDDDDLHEPLPDSD